MTITAPVVRNSALTNGDLYEAQQMRRFETGGFGFVAVELLTVDDQVFPQFGAGPMRTLDAAGPTVGVDEPVEIRLDYRPDASLDGREWPSCEQFSPSKRMFARRPSYTADGRGLRRILLELPADLGADGEVITPPSRMNCRALVLAVVEKSRLRRARSYRVVGV